MLDYVSFHTKRFVIRECWVLNVRKGRPTPLLWLNKLTKSGNVQHSNEVRGGLEGEAPVNPGDHMIEEAAVNGLG